MYEEIAGTRVGLRIDGHGSPTIVFVIAWAVVGTIGMNRSASCFRDFDQ